VQSVELYAQDSGRYRQANQQETSELLHAFEGCYAPNQFSEQQLKKALTPYQKWIIASDERSTTVGEWLNQLSAPILSGDFKARLALLSSAGRSTQYRAALEPFQLGRFCEFRAALIASRSSLVESTRVTAPNSRADAQRCDVTVVPIGAGTPIQLQIKAVDGAFKRQSSSESLAILRRVWITPLDELKRQIERMITERRIGPSHPCENSGCKIPLREY
jgi:hypothetical protein